MENKVLQQLPTLASYPTYYMDTGSTAAINDTLIHPFNLFQ